jgi:citrate lyase subunit beta/citryl-CoA lyase
MPLARSFLYVPANRQKFLDKAVDLPADALLLDLEDSVPPAEKAVARAAVRAFAPKISGARVWVRPNALDTEHGRADLEAIIGVPGLVGLIAPKVDSPDDMRRWDRAIGELEQARGVAVGSTLFVPSIESARGVWFAYEIATAARRNVSLSFGGARDGDLNTDLGCSWSADGPEMLHARQHVLVAARAAKFDTPLDGVFADIRDAAGFIRRRSSRATGSIARPRPSSTTMRACWKRSTRRWRRAAPAPQSTAR